jgi:phage terminase large subunit-like protein
MPFILDPWQKGWAEKDENGLWRVGGIITPLFGTVVWSDMFGEWVRQFSLAWDELGRKNGKSELMAALALYFLIADGEQSGEVYGAASDRDQASQVFNVARDMVLLSPVLSKMKLRREIEIVDSQKRIIHAPSRSVYRAIPADATGNLGANPHAILFDEVLAQPNELLWDYLRQGFGTRKQAMLVAATTAGNDPQSFCYSEHEFSIRVAKDPDLDPKRFVHMAYVDEDADWTDETLWIDANPGLGSFLNIQTLRDEAKEAQNKGDLSQIANFRQFRLNQWQKSSNRWLDMAVWDENDGDVDPLRLAAENIQGYGGLDLSETFDLTSWVMVFVEDGRLSILPRFWITRKALTTRHKKLAAAMENWQEAGFIRIFEGDSIIYEKVTADILEDLSTYNIQMLGYDQYQAPAIVQKIEQQTDVTCVKIPQSTTRLNAGSKELTRLMGLRQLAHGAQPVLRWNADNAAYKQDSDGNIKPDKAHSSGKIDGITATVNALSVLLIEPEEADFQIYTPDDDEDFEEDL